MCSIDTCLGHSYSQAPVLVQPPKPSASICAVMARTRSTASTRPWGRRERCETLAATKSMAEEFLHAATQAPQPMQAAASKARSASARRMGTELASGAVPALTEMKPPASITRSSAERSTTRSRTTGKASARQGST